MTKKSPNPQTTPKNRCLFYAVNDRNIENLAESLPLRLELIDTFTDFSKAQEALSSGKYSSVFCDDTCWSHECDDLINYATLLPGIRILCSTKRPITNLSSQFWALNQQYLFTHIRDDEDNLLKPLNILLQSGSRLKWVADVMRKFQDMRLKLKNDEAKILLLIGAAGTAKSALAQISHYRSERKLGDILFLNCKSISPIDVIWDNNQKKLFRENITRLLSLANGGTLYIHEIDHLDKEAQEIISDILTKKKILVEECNEKSAFNGAVIFSARHPLENMVKNNQFSRSLYNLLKHHMMCIPSLQEYSDEILEIANEIMKTLCHLAGIPVKRFTKDAMKFFSDTLWTRNLRDVLSVVKNAIFMTSGVYIKANILSAPLKPIESDSVYDKRRNVKDALAKANGNVSEAAKYLGVKRLSVYRWMKELDIPQGWGRQYRKQP